VVSVIAFGLEFYYYQAMRKAGRDAYRAACLSFDIREKSLLFHYIENKIKTFILVPICFDHN
jgi:hypothetical protein